MANNLIIVILTVGMIASLQNTFAADAQANVGEKPPAMPVEITIVKQQSLRLWKEFSGRLTAVDYVEIRPQATGLITEIKFEDGQFVTKGDILYVIDPRSLKAIVAQKKAELITAQNRHDYAEKEYTRAVDLIHKKMVAEQVMDTRLNDKLVANSAIKHARAELSEAEINLSYAYIKAPISGLISRTELTEGNLVSAGPNAPLLTSIVSNKTIYADFEVDEQTYLRYRIEATGEHGATYENPVELRIQNGDWMFPGKIHSFDNKIDPTSGTIRARAIFDNSDGKLLAGMYARLKLGSANEHEQVLISERAIGTDQNRKFVYVVNDQNKTTYREVQLGDSMDGKRLIHSGLMAGDKVIVRGLMRIQPDMLVDPQEPTTGNVQ